MTQGEIIPQADDCTRYTYDCPRGTIAIDEYEGGRREIIRCLGGAALTRRDVSAAVRLHERLLTEAEDL